MNTKFLGNFLGKLNSGKKPPLEALYIYILAIFLGYNVSDLVILNYRPLMLPQKAPPSKPKYHAKHNLKSLADYNSITQRNLFSSDGKIPPSLAELEEDKSPNKDSLDIPAVLSKLPLKLLGTIVHLSPDKSVATVNLSNKNETQSYKVKEQIESLAEILKIERKKIIFRNLATQRKEYIEMPEDSQITFGIKNSAPKNEHVSDIRQEGENSFQIKRSDLDKYTSDLPSILRQARMVPNIIPGSGGRIDGFRFVSIQPDSVYSKLGFKPGDIIKGVNGEAVTSPTQAMEMYNALKSSDKIVLKVSRDGKDEDYNYSIRE